METSRVTRLLLASCAMALMASVAHAQSGDVVISASTTWPESSYTLDSLTVQSGATLTIGGGSTVNVAGAALVTGNATILLQGKNTSGSGWWSMGRDRRDACWLAACR